MATGHTLHAREMEEPVISLKRNCSSVISATFQHSYLMRLIPGGHYASKYSDVSLRQNFDLKVDFRKLEQQTNGNKPIKD